MNTPCRKIINMLLFQVLSSQMFKLYHTKTIYWRYYNIHDVQNVHHVQKRANVKKYISNICWIILIMRKKCIFDLFTFNINGLRVKKRHIQNCNIINACYVLMCRLRCFDISVLILKLWQIQLKFYETIKKIIQFLSKCYEIPNMFYNRPPLYG